MHECLIGSSRVSTPQRERTAARDYALLREATFQRLFQQTEDDVRAQIERDVAIYNAHLQNDPAKRIRLSSIPGVGVPLMHEKKGAPPTGHLMVRFDGGGRSISASQRHTSPNGD